MKTKNNIQHTPGPWNVNDPMKGQTRKFISNGETIICEMLKNTSVSIDDESNANSKLISAAPELLEALNFALTIIDRLSDDYSATAGRHANFTQGEFKKIQSAINKATGK